VIQVVTGTLAAQPSEGLLRAVRADLSPVDAGARDVLLQAGEEVGERLEQMGGLPVGGAVITQGGDLDASFLIHVVTSADDEPETDQVVRRALRNGLRRAEEFGLESLSIPPLGIGAGHLEVEEAARSMVEVLLDHLEEREAPLELSIVVRDAYEAEVFHRAVAKLTRGR
jgi:O-acetyl-ADP-ribose deacetylase (regulator of RNase III)